MSTLVQKLDAMSQTQRDKWLSRAMVLIPAMLSLAIVYKLGVSLALIGLVGLGLILLMVAKPEAATLCVIFAVYCNLAVVVIRYQAFSEIVASSFFLLLAIPLFTFLVFRRQAIVTTPVLFLMLVYMIVLLTSALFSSNAADSFGSLLSYFLEGIVFYVLVVNTVRTPKSLRNVICTLLLSGCLMGGVSLYQEVTHSQTSAFGGLSVEKGQIGTGKTDFEGDPITRGRMTGPVGEANRFAQILVVLLPLAFVCTRLEGSRLVRNLGFVSFVPILGGIILSFSRGAAVSIVILVLMVIALGYVRLKHVLLFFAGAALLIVIAVPDYIYRMGTLGQGEENASFRGRMTENLASLEIFLMHPILGVGPGQTKLYTQKFGTDTGIRRLKGTRRGHSMYLELLSDVGVIGFACMMTILAVTIRQLVQLRKRWMQYSARASYMITGILLAVVSYLVTALFLHVSYQRYYWLLIALAGAATQIYGDGRARALLAKEEV